MSEPESIDSAAILQEYLLSDTPRVTGGQTLVAYLGGDYVACPVAPPTFRHEHKAVIFHPETEGSHITGADNQTNFVFKCYGGSASHADARAVYRALMDHLHNAREKTTSAGVLVLAHLITAFQGPPEPETGWPVMIATFGIKTRG
jgi:hypothetical protein